MSKSNTAKPRQQNAEDWVDRFAYEGNFHSRHVGQPVRVGPHTIFAGAAMDLRDRDYYEYDVLIPLTFRLPPFRFGKHYNVLAAPLRDFGGVPAGWERFLRGKVIPLLKSDQNILVFCEGGHGRTGTFLASLIAIMEPEIEDPIQEIRERYCHFAIESVAQGEAIFKLKQEELPEHHAAGLKKKLLSIGKYVKS